MKKIIGGYISLIILFGGVYYLVWVFKPNSFVFSNSFGLDPITSSEIIGDNNVNLESFQKYADSLRLELKIVEDSIVKISKLRDSIKILRDYTYKKFDESRWEAVEKFENDSIYKFFIKAELLIEERISKSLDNLEKNSLKIELGNQKIEKYNYIVKKKDYVLKNLINFGDQEKLEKFKKNDSIFTVLDFRMIPNLNIKKYQINYDIDNLKFIYHMKYYEKVSLVDFFLFSASNSTTISYGDISPNHYISKLLMLLQGGFTIILLALFTDKVVNKYRQRS